MNQELVKEVCEKVFNGKSVSTMGNVLFVQSVIDEMIDRGFDFQCDHDEDQWQAYFYRRGDYDGLNSTLVKNRPTMGEAICTAAIDAIDLEACNKAITDARNEIIRKTEAAQEMWIWQASGSRLTEEQLEKFRAEWNKCFPNYQGTIHGRFRSSEEQPQTLPRNTVHNFVAQGGFKMFEHSHPSFDYGAIEKQLFGDFEIPELNEKPEISITCESKDFQNKLENIVGKSTTCNHSWKTYTGLMETFEYCIHCNNKKGNNE